MKTVKVSAKKAMKVTAEKDPAVQAEIIVEKEADMMLKRMKAILDEFEASVKRSKKDLAGLKKAGAGLTEVGVFIEILKNRAKSLSTYATKVADYLEDTFDKLK